MMHKSVAGEFQKEVDNTTSSIVLKNPTGIDSSRIEIKALDDNA